MATIFGRLEDLPLLGVQVLEELLYIPLPAPGMQRALELLEGYLTASGNPDCQLVRREAQLANGAQLPTGKATSTADPSTPSGNKPPCFSWGRPQ